MFQYTFLNKVVAQEVRSRSDPRKYTFSLGKPQKEVLLLITGPLRGGGVKVRAIKEKQNFWKPFFQRSNVNGHLARRGGG